MTAPQFVPGMKLGKYTVVGPLGRGGMGGVWEVADETGTSFALKSPASGMNPAAEGTKFCTNCGKSIPRTAKFCPECGGAQG